MARHLLAIAFFASALFTAAQDGEFKIPRFTKTAISTSGCFAYLPVSDAIFDVSYSPDSSIVYTGDFPVDDYHYALIVVKLKDTYLAGKEEKENMLISYLDFLKESFSIEGAAGYGMGRMLESNPDAIGILDYWEDTDKDQWVVEGWADGSTIAVMMIYGPGEFPNTNVANIYLEGFRFGN